MTEKQTLANPNSLTIGKIPSFCILKISFAVNCGVMICFIPAIPNRKPIPQNTNHLSATTAKRGEESTINISTPIAVKGTIIKDSITDHSYKLGFFISLPFSYPTENKTARLKVIFGTLLSCDIVHLCF